MKGRKKENKRTEAEEKKMGGGNTKLRGKKRGQKWKAPHVLDH